MDLQVVRAIDVAMAVLLSLAFGSLAHAQSWKDVSNTATCALPVRYSLSELNDALRWNEIAMPPGALARAHASYADEIDALLPGCIPFAASVVQGSNMSTGVRVSDAELAKLRAHQRKLASAADAAEERLFDALAVAAAAAELPDDAKARLEALRARRSLARLIEGMQRRCAIRGQRWNIKDVAPTLDVSGDMKRLPPGVRIAISTALDSQAAARRSAWASAEDAVDASVAATIAEQRESEQPVNGYMEPQVEQIPTAISARLTRVELDTLRAIAKAAPEVAVRMKHAEDAVVPEQWAAPEPSDSLPRGVRGESFGVPFLSGALARLPGLDAETRAAMRPVLLAWLREDSAMATEWLDDELRASELESPDAITIKRSRDEGLLAARTSLARDNLKKLTAILKVDWLVADGIAPIDHTALPPSTAEDAREFGLTLPSVQFADAAPSREGAQSLNRWRASMGMIPMPWRDVERQDALEALQLDEAQLLIATQLFTDAADEWAKNVEPVARELQALQKSKGQSRDSEARFAAVTAIIDASALRRECWAAARAIDDRLISNLELALGPTHDEGKHYLRALRLVRAREATLQGSGALLSAVYRSHVPDVAETALTLRATPEERSLILEALAAHCADFLQARAAEWESALKIQEESEANELMHATRTRAAGDTDAGTEARVAANEESSRRVRAMYADADTLIARMKRFDGELLGRMQAMLPEHLGDRLRRAIHVTGSTPRLAHIGNQRISVLYALKRIQPDAQAEAEAAFNSALDAWEAWAEPIVNEIARIFPSTGATALATIEMDSPTARRASMLEFVLSPSAMDRVDQALCTIAAKAPPATARRIPQLARFAPAEAEQPPREPAQP